MSEWGLSSEGGNSAFPIRWDVSDEWVGIKQAYDMIGSITAGKFT